MNVLVDVNHPAHVHLFKHAIRDLRADGHDVKITARDKDIALELLSAYGFEYTVLSELRSGFPGLAVEYGERLAGMYRVARTFEPDVYIGLNPAIAHVSSVAGGESILMHDTEQAVLKEYLFSRFADRILTPACFEKDLGDNQVRYPGYHELAYLHPDRFSPDDAVLDRAGVDADDRIVVLRLVSWGASHDVGNTGFDDTEDVVRRLESAGASVVITSEVDLPASLEPYRASIPPEDVHDLMYHADLLVGESPTMATEAAVLGTPGIFVHSTELGYTNELESEYGLVYNFADEGKHDRALRTALEVLEADPDVYRDRRERLLSEKADTTDVILDHVEAMHR